MKLLETTVAAVAAVLGAGGVTAGAACCVLPLALAGIGLGHFTFGLVLWASYAQWWLWSRSFGV